MSDEQRPLSPSESELAAIASRQTPDGFLNQLVLLAERGAGIGLGLLLNGMVVTGQLVPPERIAAEIDAERRMIVSRSPRPDDVHVAPVRVHVLGWRPHLPWAHLWGPTRPA